MTTYVRVWPPLPLACKFRVSGPVILYVLGLIGTLALTAVIIHAGGVRSHGSLSCTVMTTGSNFLFGGVRTFGKATTDAIVGATL